MARATQDITIWDETSDNSAMVDSEGRLKTITNNFFSNYINGNITVGISQIEAKVGVNRLSNRKGLDIHNNGNKTIYYGTTGVTVNNGQPLEKGQFVSLNIGDIAIYLISTSNQDVRIMEWA
jgi:hypothetical protein